MSTLALLREEYKKLKQQKGDVKEKPAKKKIKEEDNDKTYCCFCEKICIEGAEDFHRIDIHLVSHRSCCKRRWGYDPKR